MDSATTFSSHSPSRLFPLFHHYSFHPRQRFPPAPKILSSFRPRPRIRRRNTLSKPTISTSPFSSSSSSSSSSDAKLQTVIDLNQLPSQASSLLHSLYDSSPPQIQSFISSGFDAYDDLQTLVTFDDFNQRVMVSCRPSTMRFLGNLLLGSCVLVFAVRGFLGLASAIRNRFGLGGYSPVVVRRDRSLGGKEVVVGTRSLQKDHVKKKKNVFLSILDSPQSMKLEEGVVDISDRGPVNRTRFEKRLPKWWPVTQPEPAFSANREEYQREANRLIRAITDNRLSGQDIMEDDILQLRHICRVSGVRVSFSTTNTRDSFYRASVDFILRVCSRAPSYSTSVQIDGEDAPQFLAGLAENIGMENTRAARIVSAAVAARTRSCFVQSWALKMQGKDSEADAELSKICLVHRIFPPEESSPEMEMVARGLGKHLKVDQRECLMDMFVGICGEEGRRGAAEALGLVLSSRGAGDQLGDDLL